VTLVIDTAPLVALADAADPLRDAVHAVLVAEDGPLIVPAPATAEIDYLLGRRLGAAARRALLADLAAGRFDVACLDHADHATVLELRSDTPLSTSASSTARSSSSPHAHAPTAC